MHINFKGKRLFVCFFKIAGWFSFKVRITSFYSVHYLKSEKKTNTAVRAE